MFATLAVSAFAAPFLKAAEPVEGEYIVVLKDSLQSAVEKGHFDRYQIAPMKRYSINNAFHGYAARLDNATIALLLQDESVKYVEENGVVRATNCFEQASATWGLVRTNNVDLKTTGTYTYNEYSKAAIGYVIDTGIYIEHSDFGGRAVWGNNQVDADDRDGNGHGTHVAGTMVGSTWGLAKYANIVAVKVLNAGGSGSYAGVLAGVQWTADYHATKQPGKTGVANMSLGGGKNQALNDALVAASKSNVLFVVASGNNNADACNYSPASAPGVLSVNAADSKDVRATFSNFGKCTNIFAPGVGVTSTWIGSTSATNTISGTSMAAPHVAGVALKLAAQNPRLDQAALLQLVLANSVADKISNPGTGSTNRNVFNGCDA